MTSKSTYLAVLLMVSYFGYVKAEEEGKVLSFFNVVKFPNALCTGSGTQNGTCYTAEECEDRSGTAAGSCADGFGVCCVIQLDCGGTSAENNTYFVKASFTTATTSSCTWSICPASTSICRIRYDFTTFITAGPATTAAAVTVGPSIGDCTSDSFTAPGAPVICGTNTGQHMFVDSDGVSCASNTFTFDGDSATRQLDIMVIQYDCKSNSGGPAGCLQYFTGTTGTVSNFNYFEVSSAITTTSRHLSSQNYDICFRRESGYCSICYIAGTAGAFGLSVSLDAAASQGALASNCQTDYIVIPNANTKTIAAITTQADGVADRFCGRWLATTSAATASESVCSNTKPFKLTFVADAGEAIAATLTEATTDELAIAPLGSTGFSLKFTQQSC